MRVAGEHELVDAERGVPGDPVSDLGVAAHQGGAGPAADRNAFAITFGNRRPSVDRY